jgi:hypothetical protein
MMLVAAQSVLSSTRFAVGPRGPRRGMASSKAGTNGTKNAPQRSATFCIKERD